MARKIPKASVNYRPAPAHGLFRRCGNCAMFTASRSSDAPPGTCTLVAGPICRRDVCDRWEPK